jgi:hypothetical protein
MGITSLFTGGLSVVYKWGAILAVALVLAGSGYGYGLHIGHLQSQVAIDNFKSKDTDALENVHVTAQKIATQVIVQYVDRVKTVTKIKTVTVQAAQNDTKDIEVLSDQWVCIHNAAVTVTDPSVCKDDKK